MNSINDEETNEEEDYSTFRTVGQELLQGKNGFCMSTLLSNSEHCYIFYNAPPKDPHLVKLTERTIIVQDSKLLEQLCIKSNLCSGIISDWTCQTKEIGRLRAACHNSGNPRKSKSNGFRTRISKKVGCTALVRTAPLRNDLLVKILPEITEYFQSNNLIHGKEIPKICIIKSVSLDHCNHEHETLPGCQKVISRMENVMNDPDLKNSIATYLQCGERNKGFIEKLCLYLEERYPHYKINYSVIKNVVSFIDGNEDDAKEMVEYLQVLKENGEIEYLTYGLDEEHKLRYVTWSFKGSKDVVDRCGDLCFWDSTHNLSVYTYKLSSFNLIDSEFRTRSVFFNLSISEDHSEFGRVLLEWHECFNSVIPPVIFTDGDEAMHVAISSLPYSAKITHLLCVFHLFDTNMKAKVKSALQSRNGADGWSKFRSSMEICREAGSEEELERLWECLLKEWFGTDLRYKNVIDYLWNFIWSKRKRWATCYFQRCFTMGYSTTQRAESWHALLKCFKNVKSLVGLVKQMNYLHKRQGETEMKCSKEPALRVASLSDDRVSFSTIVLEIATKSGFSKFACDQLQYSLNSVVSQSVREMSFHEGNSQYLEMKCDIQGTYGPVTNSITSAHVRFFRVSPTIDGSHQSLVLLADNYEQKVELHCTCLYPHRMLLGCKHIFKMANYFDQMQFKNNQESFDESKNKKYIGEIRKILSEGGFDSMLQFIIFHSVGRRWNNGNKLRPLLVTFDMIKKQICTSSMEKELVFNNWLQKKENKKGSVINFDQRHIYSGLIAGFKSLIGNILSSEHGVQISRDMLIFMKLLDDEISNWREIEKSFDDDSLFISWIKKSLHLMAHDDSRHTELKNNSPEIISEQAKEEINSDNLYLTNTASIEDPVTREVNIKIKNPPKRHDTINNPANSIPFKTRQQRKIRSNNSRRLPLSARQKNGSQELPKRPKVNGYACPLCVLIKVQTNTRNVLQHYLAKHGDLKRPKVHEMSHAATNYEQRLKQSTSQILQKSENNGLKINVQNDENIPSIMAVRDSMPNKANHMHHSLKPFLSRNVIETGTLLNLVHGVEISVFWKGDMMWYDGNFQNSVQNSESKYTIIYVDGETDNISTLKDMDNNKWRLLSKKSSYPNYSLHNFSEHSESYTSSMLLATSGNASTKDIIIFKGVSDMFSSDFRTLQESMWLTDVVIEEFLKSLLKISVNAKDDRLFLVSSQLYKLYADMDQNINQCSNPVGSTRKLKLQRWVKNLELQDFDYLIAPLNISNQHWCLTIGIVSDMKICFIDPYNPLNSRMVPLNIRESVIDCFNDMWASYFSKYGLNRRWAFDESNDICSEYNFPNQPADNSDDCGVFVSLYAWSIIIGKRIPEEFLPKRYHSGKKWFREMRECIGRTILCASDGS